MLAPLRLDAQPFEPRTRCGRTPGPVVVVGGAVAEISHRSPSSEPPAAAQLVLVWWHTHHRRLDDWTALVHDGHGAAGHPLGLGARPTAPIATASLLLDRGGPRRARASSLTSLTAGRGRTLKKRGPIGLEIQRQWSDLAIERTARTLGPPLADRRAGPGPVPDRRLTVAASRLVSQNARHLHDVWYRAQAAWEHTFSDSEVPTDPRFISQPRSRPLRGL